MGKGINQKYICVVNRDDAYRKKYNTRKITTENFKEFLRRPLKQIIEDQSEN